ncbi:MAG: methyltransferase domain-containing protein [Caldilineaceae bacterium]|nr:methyltransferase domain-containing protein [Caldilineaceae bacterium]
MHAQSIQAYNSQERAQSYHARSGFDPERKETMLTVALRLLLELTPPGASLLELGAGTGAFTRNILAAKHFALVEATDGAPAMLAIAQEQLAPFQPTVQFRLLDFTSPGWSQQYQGRSFGAVVSSMALHHAAQKRQLFHEIFQVLAPGGLFIIADHMAGASPLIDQLIGRERGRIKLASQGKEPTDEQAMSAFLQADQAKQAAEGNQCEALESYLHYLTEVGFGHVDCLWRDYWLAVFVAQKDR